MGPWGTPGSEWAALSSPRQGLCVRIGSEGIREAWIALIQRGLGLGLLGGGLGADGPGLLQRHQAASDFLSQSSDQQDLGPREPLIPAPSRAHMAAETELGLA